MRKKCSENFMNMIKIIQLSPTKDFFRASVEILKRDFPEDCEKVKNYLENVINWYEGFYSGPSTNNAIEAFHAVIKRQYTLRNRLPIADFLQTMLTMMSSQSVARSENIPPENKKEFVTVPTITKKIYNKAYEILRTKSFKKVFFTLNSKLKKIKILYLSIKII